MPITDPDAYVDMLERAANGGYAVPSINVTSSSTINAVLAGLAEAESDGIIGVGIGGARFASGTGELATGARALAEFTHAVADAYPVGIALHTDHCPPDRVDEFIRPLVAVSRERVAAGRLPLFQSHMFDGSHLDLGENLTRCESLLDELAPLGIVLELEIGLVGGAEDEIDNRDVDSAKLYTSPADMVAVIDRLGAGEHGRYMVAASFGNVHGVHPPGEVTLDPSVLARGQAAIAEAHGSEARMWLVFHGGSGSAPQDIKAAISSGVIKMNVDTDTQLAYTEAVAEHVLAHRDHILVSPGQVPDKSRFEQRAWMSLGEAAMAKRVVRVCQDLGSIGSSNR